jgi:23S rRNA pseudouridine2605 synthase
VRRVKDAFDTLARALARAGVLPAAEAQAAVCAGRVSLGGRPVREPLTVLRRGDDVRLDGKKVSVRTRTLAVMLHKPRGYVSSTRGEGSHPPVFEALAAALPEDLRTYGWHAVGRLDVDTTGLLLFTNDEGLVAHATAPATKLPKRYRARVSGVLTTAALRKLPPGPGLVSARVRGPAEVELVLSEGRFHQVKRLLGGVGLPVLALHREAVGSLVLDIPLGKARLVTDAELERDLGYPPRTFHP